MDDLISRQEAIDAINDVELNFNVVSSTDFTKLKREVQEIIDHILEAQTKALKEIDAVSAKWIPVTQTGARCSRCNNIKFTNGADLTGKALVHRALFPYCPKCGAKMNQEESNGENNN